MRVFAVRERTWRASARVALLALALAGGAARGQDAPPPADDPTARIERLEKEVQALKALLQAQTPAPPQPAAPPPPGPAPAAADKPAGQVPAETDAKDADKKPAAKE